MKGVIDIGAHWFEEYEKWKVQGAGNFLLFEPIKENYDYLKGFTLIELIRTGQSRFLANYSR
jgi:hypothetical protein